jgi:hypothetical protein
VPTAAELGSGLFDDPAVFVEVHDRTDVGSYAVTLAELAAVE